MGTWGAGAFENDTALDWVYSLEGSSDGSVIAAALQQVTGEPNYLDADFCQQAIAAAEVIAALAGGPSPSLTPEVAQWVAARSSIDTGPLVPQALTALARIEEDSELKELWEEGEHAAEWHRAMSSLRERIEQLVGSPGD